MTADVNKLFDATQDLPDFNALRNDINSMRGPLDEVTQYVDNLRDVNHFVAGACDFFAIDLVHILTNLSVRLSFF